MYQGTDNVLEYKEVQFKKGLPDYLRFTRNAKDTGGQMSAMF